MSLGSDTEALGSARSDGLAVLVTAAGACPTDAGVATTPNRARSVSRNMVVTPVRTADLHEMTGAPGIEREASRSPSPRRKTDTPRSFPEAQGDACVICPCVVENVAIEYSVHRIALIDAGNCLDDVRLYGRTHESVLGT